MNLPDAFSERMKIQLGPAFDSFVENLNQPATVSIRINPKKYSKDISYSPVPWSKYGHYLIERPSFTMDPLFHAGAYYVQEASSMFLEQAVQQTTDTTKALNVLDLCAAPGGKSTHLLSLLNSNSLLVSNEVIRSRAGILAENISKWGNANVIITNNDVASFQSLPGFFDLIVVDAPCSGEGLFRKEQKAMKEWSQQNVDLCYKRQRRILSDVWSSLKENGILIYCTCTYNKLENEENLKWLSKNESIEFVKLNTREEWGIEIVNEDNIPGYRFYPHRVKGEGFFLSVVRKLEQQKSKTNQTANKRSKLSILKNIPTQIADWIQDPDHYFFYQWNEVISLLPKEKIAEAQNIINNLNIVSVGVKAATLKNNKVIPEHSLAMSHSLKKEFINSIDLSLEEALHYLRKNTLAREEQKKGFALVKYKSLPLGWVNILENRINNLYPSNWRIRMDC